ncbi:hypothetical protein [Enteractinococcus coprophilus]|uniref:Nucleotidyltransferase n=1 Tax=Enteractinococcus coprophilus TaxID=1027633 RepID=A0A543AP77_9MICC|nr:hypothetical protein [Enteractinococcus coprophilus]TQL74377.1 hypothetical protein FB556_0841 [Enteractinococcus coprophilus]
MSTVTDTLNEVSAQIDADPLALAEARTRLNLVLEIAASYDGQLATYRSGSLAAHTMIDPVSDGDGGLILDRRSHPDLGPEGRGETPLQIVEELRSYMAPVIRKTYPKARVTTSKRGPMVHFGQPINGQNPTVDLVVALTRKEDPGLWIPNLNTRTWDASDPQRHVVLLASGTDSQKRLRRRVIRLAKAWNNQYTDPGVSSFLLSVWAYEFIRPGMGVAAGLHALFEGAATRLESSTSTPDPAGVSPDLKPELPIKQVRPRLRTAADTLHEAISSTDDQDTVRAALARLYPKYISFPEQASLADAVALLSARKPTTTAQLGLTTTPAVIPPTRSYGDKL